MDAHHEFNTASAVPVVASARWAEATQVALEDAVKAHAAIEAQQVRLNQQVKYTMAQQALSGQRCTRLTLEYATKEQYHGELIQAIFGRA